MLAMRWWSWDKELFGEEWVRASVSCGQSFRRRRRLTLCRARGNQLPRRCWVAPCHFLPRHKDSEPGICHPRQSLFQTNKIKIYFNGYRKEPPHLHWDIVRLAAYGIIGKDSVSDFGLPVICSCVFWRKETTKRFHPNYFLEDICTGCIFGMLGSNWSRLCNLFSYPLVFESSLY